VPAFPFAIASNGTDVYWIEQPMTAADDAYNGNATARIMRVAIAGPAKGVALATGQPLATALALLGPHVYWATSDGAISSTLHRTSASCVPPSCTDEIVGTLGAPRISKLVAAGTSALVALAPDGQVTRFDVGPGWNVAAAKPMLMTTSSVNSVAVTSTHVYASSLTQKTISRATIDGLTTEPSWATFAFDGGDPGNNHLASDCTTLFGTRSLDAFLQRVLLADATISPLDASLQLSVYDVAADAAYVYLASANGNGIHAVDKTNGTTYEIAHGASAFWIAVDSAGVYWGDHASPGGSGGTITMMVKK
jgi:hypothetical protein